MSSSGPSPISIGDAIAELRFLPDRTPSTPADQSAGSFSELSTYRDGGIFVGHWAGRSEWERHAVGDEIVMVVGGQTTIVFLTDGGEQAADLRAGELVVVPAGMWHRFETAERVQLMTATPQPTDHSVTRPG